MPRFAVIARFLPAGPRGIGPVFPANGRIARRPRRVLGGGSATRCNAILPAPSRVGPRGDLDWQSYASCATPDGAKKGPGGDRAEKVPRRGDADFLSAIYLVDW